MFSHFQNTNLLPPYLRNSTTASSKTGEVPHRQDQYWSTRGSVGLDPVSIRSKQFSPATIGLSVKSRLFSKVYDADL